MLAAVAALMLVATRPAVYAQQDSSVEQSSPEAGGELKNVAVIAAAKWEKLIGDVGFLGSLAGKPEMGQMTEGMFSFFTQGKGPNAVDKTKSFGVIVQTDGANFFPVGVLPVKKPKDLIDVAKGYGAEVKDAGDGVQELALPNQRSLFVKQNGDTAFVSSSAAALAKTPANAQEILSKLVGDYDLAGHVAVRNVPEMYRQFALQAMQAGAQQGLKKKENESDEEYAKRQKTTEAQMEQMSRMINEIDSLKFGWAVNSKEQRTFGDMSYTFLPDSKTAKQISSYKPAQTKFAGFYQPDAAVTMTMATQVDPKLMADDMAQMDVTINSTKDQLFTELDKKVDDEEVRDALKSAISDWFDAIGETLKSGSIDGGAALNASADSLTLVAGVHVKDTAKVESGLKKFEAGAKKRPDFPGIKWNAANHAGVSFHTMSIPVPADKEGPRKMLGENLDIAVGIGQDAVYLAAGKQNMDAVSKAIDASASATGKTVPPFEMTISLLPIMEVAAAQADSDQAKEVSEKVAEYLRTEAQGRDHIRVVEQIVPNGVKVHFEAEEGVLKGIGKASEAVQKQRMQRAGQ
jgi:hypothetical protein